MDLVRFERLSFRYVSKQMPEISETDWATMLSFLSDLNISNTSIVKIHLSAADLPLSLPFRVFPRLHSIKISALIFQTFKG